MPRPGAYLACVAEEGARGVLGSLTTGITRSIGAMGETLTRPFSDPVIRLGVTGLSRVGKTVFITSLVANLLDRDRMPGLVAAARGRIKSAYLQPQPDDTLPRFEFESHLNRMTAANPAWPDGTRHVSELRLSLRVRPSGLIAGLSGPRSIHLDIVDYPGEWLLDLGLMDKSFEDWSEEVLTRIENRAEAAEFRAVFAETDPSEKLHEPVAQRLASAFTRYLRDAREAG